VPARDEGRPSTSSRWVEYWSQSPAQWATGTPSPGLRTSTPPASSASKVATFLPCTHASAPALAVASDREPARPRPTIQIAGGRNTTRKLLRRRLRVRTRPALLTRLICHFGPMRARPCATYFSTPRWIGLDRIADGIRMRDDGRMPARACVDVPYVSRGRPGKRGHLCGENRPGPGSASL
jgi:hypothetical protein